jgi:hypothetical protein
LSARLIGYLLEQTEAVDRLGPDGRVRAHYCSRPATLFSPLAARSLRPHCPVGVSRLHAGFWVCVPHGWASPPRGTLVDSTRPGDVPPVAYVGAAVADCDRWPHPPWGASLFQEPLNAVPLLREGLPHPAIADIGHPYPHPQLRNSGTRVRITNSSSEASSSQFRRYRFTAQDPGQASAETHRPTVNPWQRSVKSRSRRENQ